MGMLFLWLSLSVAFIVRAEPDGGGNLCGETVDLLTTNHRVTVESPEEWLGETCIWQYAAPKHKRLVIHSGHVHWHGHPNLIENATSGQYSPDSVIVEIDDSAPYIITQNCDQCLNNLTASSIKIALLPGHYEGDRHRHVGFTFHLRAYDMNQCPRPQAPENGLVVGKNHKIGDMVRYQCKPPYIPDGSEWATCETNANNKTHAVPKWVPESPKCIVPSCLTAPGGVVHLPQAESGALVHPGYPHSFALPAKPCTWEVNVGNKRLPHLHVHHLHLPTIKGYKISLSVYDGKAVPSALVMEATGKTPAKNLTLQNHKFTVVLSAQPDGTSEIGAPALSDMDLSSYRYGFFVHYDGVVKNISYCPSVGIIDHGKVVVSKVVRGKETEIKDEVIEPGYKVTFSCTPGWSLFGAATIECKQDGSWTSAKPWCVKDTENEGDLDDDDYEEEEDNEDQELETLINSAKESKNKWTAAPHQDTHEKLEMPEKKLEGKNPESSAPDRRVYVEKIVNEADVDEKPAEENGAEEMLDNSFVSLDPLIVAELENEIKLNTINENDELYWTSPNMVLYTALLISIVPIGLIVILIVVFLVYRRKYPVRMGVGRRFNTFENPIYQSKKKNRSNGSSFRDPVELERLTLNRSQLT